MEDRSSMNWGVVGGLGGEGGFEGSQGHRTSLKNFQVEPIYVVICSQLPNNDLGTKLYCPHWIGEYVLRRVQLLCRENKCRMG